jgi:hypothetical protein
MSRRFVEPSLQEFITPENLQPIASDTVSSDRDPEWIAFEKDLRRGLKTVKVEVLQRIRGGEKPGLISVSRVLSAAGRGRTQFYQQHSNFQVRIKLVDAAAKRLWARAQLRRTEPTKTELQTEVRRLKAEMKAIERRLASQKVGEFVELLLAKRNNR